jgi:valyl-tRNA synthetase
MVSGFVLAKKGEKISKSKSNSDLSPQNMIKINSADVLRYWAANSKLGTDTFFSPDDLSAAKRFLTKLWNASKFAILQLQDIDLTAAPELLPIDRWIIERTNETISKATDLLNEYEIGSARHEIDDFFWKDFCDYYIEIAKERLYQPEKHGEEERKSGQYALYYALFNILKLYAIYVPHITDHIYREFFRAHEKAISIHSLIWEKPRTADKKLLEFGERLKDIIAGVRKQKSESNQSMKTEIEELKITVPEEFTEYFRKSEKDIKACTNAKSIEINKG